MVSLKEENGAKIEQAIKEFDLGSSHLDKRRDLARSRSLQARQLQRSIEVERPLWNALYTGKLHRLDLQYDSTIPPPQKSPDDWKAKSNRSNGGVN